MMYSAGVPDGKLDLFLADTKKELFNNMSTASPRVRRTPVKSWAAQPAAPGIYATPTSDPPDDLPREKTAAPKAAKGAGLPHVYDS